MNQANKSTKIFLSYAKEDESKVDEIYQFLQRAGFKPWMSKYDILPGQDWREDISDEIESSDFFIIFLSRNSVYKRGVVQREIKKAFDVYEGMLPGEIYLIPVRLEDCDVPETLADYQWVDLFEKDGKSRLEKMIREEMERRLDPTLAITIDAQRARTTKRIRKTNLLRRYRRQISLAILSLMVVSSPWIYNNYFFRVPRPELPTTFCKASPVPVRVGVANLPGCSTEFREILTKNWENEKGDVSDIPRNFETSPDARSSSGDYDIVVWGACSETEANSATLQFELISPLKSFEIYQPTTLTATSSDSSLSDLGLAIINYQFRDFSQAHRQFNSLPFAASSIDISLLQANSLLFNGQPRPAIDEYKKIIRVFPAISAAAYNNMGVATSTDDRNLALVWLSQAVGLAGDTNQLDLEALARANRSRIYLLDDKWEEAEEDCDQVALLNANSAKPHICLAYYYFYYARFGDPGVFLPLGEIGNNLDNAENRPDTPALLHFLRADWHKSHVWRRKQDAVDEFEHYLLEIEFSACLPSDHERKESALNFIKELTKPQK